MKGMKWLESETFDNNSLQIEVIENQLALKRNYK